VRLYSFVTLLTKHPIVRYSFERNSAAEILKSSEYDSHVRFLQGDRFGFSRSRLEIFVGFPEDDLHILYAQLVFFVAERAFQP